MNRKTKKHIIFWTLFPIALYYVAVVKLWQLTGKIEWNIFQSEAFPYFIKFCVFAGPIIIALAYAFTGAKKEKIEIYKQNKEKCQR